MNWNRWAATYDEFVPYHMDDEGAKENGQPAVIGQGRIRVSYLHTLVRKWIGEEGVILTLNAQLRGINFKNDVLTCTGHVTDKRIDDDGQRVVDLELLITNQNGERVTPAPQQSCCRRAPPKSIPGPSVILSAAKNLKP